MFYWCNVYASNGSLLVMYYNSLIAANPEYTVTLTTFELVLGGHSTRISIVNLATLEYGCARNCIHSLKKCRQ